MVHVILDDVRTMNKQNKFAVEIDSKKCIECGLCTEVNGDVFEMKNHKCSVKDDVDLSDSEIQSKINDSSIMCPVGAIKINS